MFVALARSTDNATIPSTRDAPLQQHALYMIEVFENK